MYAIVESVQVLKCSLHIQNQSHYIEKSRGEVSLIEQDTIENVSAAYLKFMIIF